MSWLDTAKDLTKLVQKLDNVEDQQKLIEVSTGAMQLQAENQELRDKVTELARSLAFSEEIEFDGVSHMKKGSPDERFCTPCWESKRLGIHLLKSGTRLPTCPVCKWEYRFGVKTANQQRTG